MKNFFYNTYIGVVITLTVIATITFFLVTTIMLIIYGGGRSIYTTMITEEYLPKSILISCDYVWTVINIIVYLITLINVFLILVSRVDSDLTSNNFIKTIKNG